MPGGFDVWEQSDETVPVPDWLPEELRGYNVVRLSQSFIESWRKCPRSAVADRHRPTFGEAAAKGILAHALVDGRVAHQGITDEVDKVFLAEKLDELTEGGWVRPDGHEFLEEVYAIAGVLTETYLAHYHDVYAPPNGRIETEAKGMILYDLRDEVGHDVDFILMTGSADLLCFNGAGTQRLGVDWKSGSRMPEPWQVRRYGVQWRIYAVMFELDEMAFHYPLALNPLNGGKGDWVANRYDGIVRCYANAFEREAFRRQILDEARPIASALLRSTDHHDHDIRPTDWHCSAKWCQVFARHECIGQDTAVTWVNKSHEEAPTSVGVIQTPRGKQ